MASRDDAERPFYYDWLRAATPAFLRPLVLPLLPRVLRLHAINRIYQEHLRHHPPDVFCRKTLRAFGVEFTTSDDDLAKIPREGGLIVAANHPFGAVDGLAVPSLVMAARPDVRILGNELLGCFAEGRPLLIGVDPFENATARQTNITPLKDAIRWLEAGGALVMFPAGEVAHLDWRLRGIQESAWSAHVVRLARQSGASVAPVFVGGANSALFQLAGLLHPWFRTALLPRELLNKRGLRCRIRIGAPISVQQMPSGLGDREAAAYLRKRACALGNFGRRSDQPRSAWARARDNCERPRPVAPPVDPELMAREIDRLPPRALLCANGDLDVYCARRVELPNVMKEVGRQREITFRAAGEGTGKSVDLDQFDEYYDQLVVWNRGRQEVVGAYRLALTDEIVRDRGSAGLYSSAAFSFSPQFLQQMGPAVELGRSFVRPEYQKSFSPLVLLWRAIAQFVLQRPQYSRLFGAVSISSGYSLASRELIVAYLSRPPQRSLLFPLAKAQNSFEVDPRVAADLDELVKDADSDRLNALVADLEPDGHGLPVLFKQYLKLGAKSLAFGVDPLFGNCLDCLCVVDLLETQRRVLDRYMGRKETARFLEIHGRTDGGAAHAASNTAKVQGRAEAI